MVFEGYSISVKGASHDASGKPCQDSSVVSVNGKYAVAAVSDGHGSPRYYRSEIGSRMAVKAAVDTVSSCMGSGYAEFMDGLKSDAKSVLARLTDAVLARWTEDVTAYDDQNPPTKEELSFESPDSERDILRAYGATLICGVVSDDAVFGFQIGDGELVAVNDESEESIPVPEDPDCFLNRTSSICSSEASSKFRHFIVSMSVEDTESDGFRAIRADPRKVTSVSVCTDGFSTSFNSEESLGRYCAAVPWTVFSGEKEKLEANLELRSRSNTCDDVSLSTVFRSPPHHDPPSAGSVSPRYGSGKKNGKGKNRSKKGKKKFKRRMRKRR